MNLGPGGGARSTLDQELRVGREEGVGPAGAQLGDELRAQAVEPFAPVAAAPAHPLPGRSTRLMASGARRLSAYAKRIADSVTAA